MGRQSHCSVRQGDIIRFPARLLLEILCPCRRTAMAFDGMEALVICIGEHGPLSRKQTAPWKLTAETNRTAVDNVDDSRVEARRRSTSPGRQSASARAIRYGFEEWSSMRSKGRATGSFA